MKISIVIPTLDRPLKLNSCLKSLFLAINKNKVIDLEILVIDQSDDSQTKNLCSNYVVNYFHNNIKGLSKARNVGILNSKGEYINRGSKKILGIKYTPDFIGKDYIIECKGRPNESFPLRWKLFKLWLTKNNIGKILYKPQNQKEVDRTIALIKEHRRKKRG